MGARPGQLCVSVLELRVSPRLSTAEQGDQPQAVNLLRSKCRAKSLWGPFTLVLPVPGTALGKHCCLEGAGMQWGSDGGREVGVTGGHSSLSETGRRTKVHLKAAKGSQAKRW